MEDRSEMQMISMSMKSGTSNSSGLGCLVGSTVGLAVGVGGGEVAERVIHILPISTAK